MSDVNGASAVPAAVKRSAFVERILDLLEGSENPQTGSGHDLPPMPDAAAYEIGFACGAEYAVRNRSEQRARRLATLRNSVGDHWCEFFVAVPEAMSRLWEQLCPDNGEGNAAAFFSQALRARLIEEVTADHPRFLWGFADGALAVSEPACRALAAAT